MSTITMTECTVPHFDELHFEEKGHTYTVNGQLYPSVSTLMRPLSEAHYEGIDMSVLAKAAERGTIVHNAIENFILFGIEDIDPQYEGYFLAFKKWWKEVNPVALGSECAVYHRVLQYAGTADLPVVIGGQKILVDVKTSANVNRMLTGIQLEAYDKAFESHGFTFDGKAILHLKKDGKYSWRFYPHNDEESWNVFCALITVNNHIRKFRR